MAKVGIERHDYSAHGTTTAQLYCHSFAAAPGLVFSDVSRWSCCLPAYRRQFLLGPSRRGSLEKSGLDIAGRSHADLGNHLAVVDLA